MKVTQRAVRVRTTGRGFSDVTSLARDVVRESSVQTGTCSVFCAHTSASLVIQENADPAVLRDLASWMSRVAPEDARAYEHADEGDDDMPAHLRSAITRSSETIPVTDGALGLGTWQAIYLWEHRTAPHQRTLVITVIGQ